MLLAVSIQGQGCGDPSTRTDIGDGTEDVGDGTTTDGMGMGNRQAMGAMGMGGAAAGGGGDAGTALDGGDGGMGMGMDGEVALGEGDLMGSASGALPDIGLPVGNPVREIRVAK